MLSLSPEYIQLLEVAGNPLHESHPRDLPPLPLSPFARVVVGRLSSLQCVSDAKELIIGIKAVNVKTSIKRSQIAASPSPHSPGRIAPDQQLAGPEQSVDLDAVATAAENPKWVQDIVRQSGEANSAIRYLIVEDILHPNSYAMHTHTHARARGLLCAQRRARYCVRAC
jgi:hypothetical protein